MIVGMCRAWIEAGHQVTLLAIDDYRPKEEESYPFDIVYFKNNTKSIFPDALPCSFKMHSYIKKHAQRFDLILSSEVFGFHSLSAAIWAPGKTLIWQELTAHQRKMRTIPSRIWHSCIVPLFFRKIRVVVARSEPAQKFISHYISHVSDEYVDHGIDIRKFHVSEIKKRQFISIAQLIPRKRVDLIIDKFARFTQDEAYSDFKLLIAGRGILENELKEKVRSLCLEKNIRFLGFLNHTDLNKHLSESVASLVYTNNDLNMVSIPESIVSGTPIVTNTVPALSEFIRDKKLGIVNDDWGYDELKEIAENNIYHSNCLKQRNLLSSQTAAQRLINIFLKTVENQGNEYTSDK